MIGKNRRQLKRARRDPINYVRPNVYFIGDDKVGKICEYKLRASYIFDMGNLAYNNGIQVPKMLGIFGLINPFSWIDQILDFGNVQEFRKWHVVMQRINGKPITKLNEESQKEEATKQLEEQIQKLFDIRICPIDARHPSNSLFDEKEGKLYLIDFDGWYEVENGKTIDRSMDLKPTQLLY